MDTLEKTRLFVLISLCRQQYLPALHEALSNLLATGTTGPVLNLHLAARHFPSTWGRVSKAQPIQADPSTLSPDQLKAWQQWVSEGRIHLVPAGFAGACGDILNQEEYRAEIEWTIANSWKSGFKDCFGVAPSLLLPFWPGRNNPESNAVVFQNFTTLGLGRLPGKPDQLVVRSADGLAALPLLDLDCDGKRSPAEQIREFHRHQTPGDLVIKCEFCGQAGMLKRLSEALVELATEGWETTSKPNFRPLIIANSSQLPNSPEPLGLRPLIKSAPELGPDFRNHLQSMPEGRRGRSATQERLRTQILGFLPHDSTYRLPIQAAPDLLSRSLLANMEGEASIMADGYEARFEGGVWKGLFAAHLPDLAGIKMRSPAGSSLTINGKAWHYEVESSVSFETDCSRGLRNTLVLATPDCRIPGRMMSDYVVTDHGPHLLIDVQIRYPWLENTPVIEEVQPWRLVLDLPDGCNDVRLRWYDHQEDGQDIQFCPGQATAADIAESQASQPWWQKIFKQLSPTRHSPGDSGSTCRFERHFFGHRWILRWQAAGQQQGLIISRLPSEEASSAPLELRLHQDNTGRGGYLEIFPEGRYHQLPTEDLRSLNHHFVLAVMPLFTQDAAIPELHAKVEKECSRYYMVRES